MDDDRFYEEDYEAFLKERRERQKRTRSLGMIWDDFAWDHPVIAWSLMALFMIVCVGGGMGLIAITLMRIFGWEWEKDDQSQAAVFSEAQGSQEFEPCSRGTVQADETDR